MPIQIILLLLASTDTPTTGGLESFFKKDSFLGMNASLGLFHMMHHWKAEAYPFKFRINSVKRLNITPGPESKIELFNMTETVYWSEVDRWNYSDPQHPVLPSYKLYTGMSLGETFAVFFVILAVQCLSLLVVKIKHQTSSKARATILKSCFTCWRMSTSLCSTETGTRAATAWQSSGGGTATRRGR